MYFWIAARIAARMVVLQENPQSVIRSVIKEASKQAMVLPVQAAMLLVRDAQLPEGARGSMHWCTLAVLWPCMQHV